MASCVANAGWIFLWHYEFFPLTVAVMVILLLLLIAIYVRLGIGQARPTTAERWLVFVPFSIYLGWIAVATIANATIVLYWAGWSGWGIAPEAWTVLMLAAGLVIATAVSLTRADVAYLLVIVWAYVGIAVKQSGAPVVAAAAAAMAVLIALVMLGGLLRRLRRTAPAA